MAYLTAISVTSLPNSATWIIGTVTYILVFYIGAISLDLELGSLGLPNFGKVAFFAIGAYGFVLTYSACLTAEIYPLFGLVLAVVVALATSSLFGFILAIPTVRLRADYFAIITIAGGEIVRSLLTYERRYLWQLDPFGIPQQLISNELKTQFVSTFPFDEEIILPSIPFLSLGSVFVWEVTMMLVFFGIALAVYKLVEIIRKSPYGRTLRAIREDDISVTSVGKDVYRFRWQTTTLAAFIAGIGGILFATTFSAFESSDFRPFLTFDLFVFIIIGGIGNSRGAAAGTALVVTFLRSASTSASQALINFRIGPETVVSLPFLGDIHIVGELMTILQIDAIINPFNSRFVVLGLILLLFLLYMPDGLIPERKIDNERYLKLLSKEEREESDKSVRNRQGTTEKEQIKLDQVITDKTKQEWM